MSPIGFSASRGKVLNDKENWMIYAKYLLGMEFPNYNSMVMFVIMTPSQVLVLTTTMTPQMFTV